MIFQKQISKKRRMTASYLFNWIFKQRRRGQMKRIFSFYAILGLLFLLSVALNAYTDTKTTGNQYSFVTAAGQANMAEVELANLALSKSQNEDVKEFAQMMITDHSKANDELKGLAMQKKYEFPADVNMTQKALAENLSKLSGAAFDREYVKAMVTDHEGAVKLFSNESKAGKDADLKTWALATLPTLKTHLQQAQDLQAKLK
jgi:putative membrane protein